MPVNRVDEVIQRLTDLVGKCEREENPSGYFAALYLDVTRLVGNAISKGNVFEDNDRLEAVDVCFASRYFDAMNASENGKTLSLPWQITFDALKIPGTVVDQHFMAAANAHINFDLAVAVGQTCRGNAIYSFRKDFDAMNEILFGMNKAVNGMITKIWPPVSILLRLFGSRLVWIEDAIMKHDRERAWNYAVRIATSDPSSQQKVIREMEVAVWQAGVHIVLPPWWLRRIFAYIAKNERGNVAYRIKLMIERTTNPVASANA
jgi:hypothetical protein